ncbi:MAG: hypothetical protein J6Z31_03295 [Fibrobacter sp.]|nr:hypothetical protein [Fibrobacter sp.]
MRIFTILLFFIFAICDARIVTFTATSNVSQEDADKQAMAGVAVQIRSTIAVSHSTQKSEIHNSKQSNLQKKYSESIQVRSELTLDGVELKRQKIQKNTWQTTAILDTEKATASLRQKLFDTKFKAQQLDSIICNAIGLRQYEKAIQAYGELVPLQLSHQRASADISIFEPLDKSYAFKANVPALEALIAESVAGLQISVVGEVPSQVEDNALGPFRILVQNALGPVSKIKVLAEQNEKILAEAFTDSSGIVVFNLKNVETFKGEHFIHFRIFIPKFSKQSPNLEQRVSYTSSAPNCTYTMNCQEEGAVCIAFENLFSKAGFEENKNGKKVTVQLETITKHIFEDGPKKISTVEFLISLTGDKIRFTKQIKGTGSSEFSAKSNAIYKISVPEIQQALQPLCE